MDSTISELLSNFQILDNFPPDPSQPTQQNRRGWEKEGEMTQTLYAHMNKRKKKKINK
jgi:hypothetical protein